MKIKKDNYLGIDHSKINEQFEGELTFVNYMSVKFKCGSHRVAAVYRAAKPNREKGHKEFMLLYSHYDPILLRRTHYVAGRELEELEKDAVHDGIYCTECETVLVSLSGHDFVQCECPNKAFADGGKSYLRSGASSLSKIRDVEVNLLTDEVIFVDGK